MSITRLAVTALATGGLLGTIFFGGLWWTVRSGLAAKSPALWFASSMLVRMSLVLTGFYLISADGWPGLMLCLLGFLVARAAVTRFTRPATGTGHAT